MSALAPLFTMQSHNLDWITLTSWINASFTRITNTYILTVFTGFKQSMISFDIMSKHEMPSNSALNK